MLSATEKLNLAFLSIKQAAAGRALLRAGQLSEQTIARLRGSGHLPSPMRYTEGLERGNQALLKKFPISDLSSSRTVGGPFIPVISDHQDDPARAGMIKAVLGDDYIRSKLPMAGTLHTGQFLNRVTTAFPEMRGVAETLWPTHLQQISALIRRHEINEAQTVLGKWSRGIRDIKALRPQFEGHQSPKILMQEGQNLAGLSPQVQHFMAQMRLVGPVKSRELAQLRAWQAKNPRVQLGAYNDNTSVLDRDRMVSWV